MIDAPPSQIGATAGVAGIPRLFPGEIALPGDCATDQRRSEMPATS